MSRLRSGANVSRPPPRSLLSRSETLLTPFSDDSWTNPIVKNKRSASILNTNNPTMSLTVGVTISAPDPRLPVEDMLPSDPVEQKPMNASPRERCLKSPMTSGADIQWQPEPAEDLAAQIAAEIKRGIPVRNAAMDVETVRWSRVCEKCRDSTENDSTVNLWSTAFS